MDRESQQDAALQFHLKEFEELKKEILQHQKFELTLELTAVSGVFAVISFLILQFQKIEEYHLEMSWWLPFIIIVVARVLTLGLNERDRQIGAYIKRLEALYATDGQGWEMTVHPAGARRQSRVSIRKRWFWRCLFLIGIGAGAVMTGSMIANFAETTLHYIVALRG